MHSRRLTRVIRLALDEARSHLPCPCHFRALSLSLPARTNCVQITHGMTKQEEEAEEEQEGRVREWEEGLPSLADLISLSQCLISPQLASAFSITSPSPPPSADVALASHTAFSSLRRAAHAYPDLLGKVNLHPHPHAGERTLCCVEEPQLNGGARTFHSVEAPGGLTAREWHRNSQPANAGHLRSDGGDVSVGKYHIRSGPLDSYGGGDLKASERGGDGDDEGEGEVHASRNAGPCISDSSDVGTRVDADNEAEEFESTPSPAENPNAETTARTLKRPRLVWTPELRKRFVDAVSHLGVKTAVPKTIMQLMNVEGLTRENVASHLQKYRLYLKRMQGLSNEGPTSSDLLFASTPVLAGLATPGRFHTGMPVHLQDINQVPFAPSLSPVSMGRGHVAGIMSGPLPRMDSFSFNIFARPPSHRFVQGDVQDVQGFRQYQSASSQ